MALGAQRSDVLRLVISEGARMALVGVALSLGGSMWLTGVIETLLYDVNPNDPWVFTGVASLLTVVALAACYLPARRATQVDPIVALRCE